MIWKRSAPPRTEPSPRRAAGLMLAWALLLLGASCTWTLSRQRQQRISDCLSQCERGQQPERGSLQPSGDLRDQRSPCEQRCHALK